jgi:hypothetical protein
MEQLAEVAAKKTKENDELWNYYEQTIADFVYQEECNQTS